MEGLGFCADSDAVITMDGDSQHPPGLIPEMIRAYEEGNEIVNTLRRPSVPGTLRARARQRLGTAFYSAINKYSETPVPLESADFRLLSKKAVTALMRFKENAVFVRGLVGWLGYRQASIEYSALPRSTGTSKYGFSKSLSFALRAVLTQTTSPLKIVWVILGFSLAGTFLVSVWTLSHYLSGTNLPEGWPTVILLLMSTFSVQLVVLGIFSAYLGAIANEVKRRPRALVSWVYGFGAETETPGQ
jgi:dolichol-phosphate mannosyltransferase